MLGREAAVFKFAKAIKKVNKQDEGLFRKSIHLLLWSQVIVMKNQPTGKQLRFICQRLEPAVSWIRRFLWSLTCSESIVLFAFVIATMYRPSMN